LNTRYHLQILYRSYRCLNTLSLADTVIGLIAVWMRSITCRYCIGLIAVWMRSITGRYCIGLFAVWMRSITCRYRIGLIAVWMRSITRRYCIGRIAVYRLLSKTLSTEFSESLVVGLKGLDAKTNWLVANRQS
jgi:hypothetical protein